jgi:hypothetical protein
VSLDANSPQVSKEVVHAAAAALTVVTGNPFGLRAVSKLRSTDLNDVCALLELDDNSTRASVLRALRNILSDEHGLALLKPGANMGNVFRLILSEDVQVGQCSLPSYCISS